MSDATSIRQSCRRECVAGAMLAFSATMSVLVMAHHPTGTALAATLGRAVHALLMVLIVLITAGFFRFSAVRGLDRYAVAAALAFYVAAALANLLAGSINGFVVPALLERGVYEESATLLWKLNQTFAKCSVFATAAAYGLWSLDLLMRGKGVDRLLGAAGFIAGAAPAALLVAGALDMNVAGAIVIYGAQALFAVLAGIWLATRKVD